MKKILLFLALLVLLASPSFASVGINVNGTTVGTAGNIYAVCPSGSSPFIDGFNWNVATCSTTLVADGTYNGGYVSVGTIDTGITLTNVLFQKAISGASGGTATDSLPNGTPDQILTIQIMTVSSSGTWTVTPSTSQTIKSIVFNTQGQLVTLLYVSNTVGWVVVSNTNLSNNLAVATVNTTY